MPPIWATKKQQTAQNLCEKQGIPFRESGIQTTTAGIDSLGIEG